MDILFRHGDLLTAPEEAIIHGCNSHGVMGSGVARVLRDKYPKAYEDYRREYEENGLPLGSVVWSQQNTHEKHLVGNAITQKDFGSKSGERYVSYDAIADVIAEVNRVARSRGLTAVAMPLIGAGLAQGRWPIIARIIETEATDFRPVVYLIDGVIPQ